MPSIGISNGSAHAPVRSRATKISGEIFSVSGSVLTARLPRASVGDLCFIKNRDERPLPAQVISFQQNLFSLAPFEEPEGVYPGATVETNGEGLTVPVGDALLGRIINPLGVPIDGKQRLPSHMEAKPIFRKPPAAISRPMIEKALITGVRSIDAFCTLGQGQRIGIFASAGVGKSTLLAMMARRAAADVIVVALVGERGREVREFVEDTLGFEGMERSIVVVATSDESSIVRQTAPFTATAIAEHFSEQGKNVLLIVDSLTRTARALRETSLAAGELPVRHGYTSSVYIQLPKLLERAGRSGNGSITALYTVLTNEEDDIDPLADEIKSLLDGHLVLRRELAARGVLPALDVTASVSRLFTRLHDSNYVQTARRVQSALYRLFKEREIVLLGGTPDAELETILGREKDLLDFLRQGLNDAAAIEDTRVRLLALAEQLRLSKT